MPKADMHVDISLMVMIRVLEALRAEIATEARRFAHANQHEYVAGLLVAETLVHAAIARAKGMEHDD